MSQPKTNETIVAPAPDKVLYATPLPYCPMCRYDPEARHATVPPTCASARRRHWLTVAAAGVPPAVKCPRFSPLSLAELMAQAINHLRT